MNKDFQTMTRAFWCFLKRRANRICAWSHVVVGATAPRRQEVSDSVAGMAPPSMPFVLSLLNFCPNPGFQKVRIVGMPGHGWQDDEGGNGFVVQTI